MLLLLRIRFILSGLDTDKVVAGIVEALVLITLLLLRLTWELLLLRLAHSGKLLLLLHQNMRGRRRGKERNSSLGEGCRELGSLTKGWRSSVGVLRHGSLVNYLR